MMSKEIWSFETKNYRVVYAVEPEYDLDLSWDISGATRKGLDSGQLVAFVAHVYVIHKPTGIMLGDAYLGECVYETPEAFIDHRGARGIYGSYFVDMIRVVIENARKARELIARSNDNEILSGTTR